jgi:hypothetical protein
MIPKFLRPEAISFASIELVIVLCSWCPTFDRTVDSHAAAHGLCPTCAALLARPDEPAADDTAGDACSSRCGYCGRCS